MRALDQNAARLARRVLRHAARGLAFDAHRASGRRVVRGHQRRHVQFRADAFGNRDALGVHASEAARHGAHEAATFHRFVARVGAARRSVPLASGTARASAARPGGSARAYRAADERGSGRHRRSLSVDARVHDPLRSRRAAARAREAATAARARTGLGVPAARARRAGCTRRTSRTCATRPRNSRSSSTTSPGSSSASSCYRKKSRRAWTSRATARFSR